MPTVIPSMPLGCLGRAADHGIGARRDAERFRDLVEQRLGPGVVCLHDQLAEPGRVAEPLAAAQHPGGVQDHRELVDRSTAERSPRHRSSTTGQRVRCSDTSSSCAR